MKLLFTFFLSVFVTFSFSQQYKPVDGQSEIKFTIKNFGLNTNGTFSGLKGDINFNPSQLSSASLDVSIAVNTINTGIDMRDNHLKKEEYFDAEKYPEISFKSTKITTDSTGYKAFGLLTIKGISKNISFPFTAVAQNKGMLFSGSFSINRKDFGVGGNSSVMGSNVDVNLKVFAQ